MKTSFIVLCAVVPTAFSSAQGATVLITGADRGLGFEFTRQYAARGDTVIATCRHPEKATDLHALAQGKANILIEKLDVNEDRDIQALAARYRGKPIDVLINNAGVLGAHDEQSLGTFSRKAFADVMQINSYGPLAVSEALRANVLASTQKKIVAITSGLGSIAIAGGMPNGPYYYRMSKAALNMGMQALGADLKSQGAIVAVVSPGIAETDMLSSFRSDYHMSGTMSTVTAAQSVAGMIGVIDKLDQSTAVQGVLVFNGKIMSW